MIKVDNIDVWGFEHAIRGMRNPLNSWDRIDSCYCKDKSTCKDCTMYNAEDGCHEPHITSNAYSIGNNDLFLMRKLCKAGHPHRKYLRQIMVSMDITAPLYLWKEIDTYKVGTTANSCSTMHKIHAKEFTLDDFSHEHLLSQNSECITPDFYNSTVFSPQSTLTVLIHCLNICRQNYLDTKDKVWWWQMIQLLPSSYNQKRTVTMNYENVVNMLEYRQDHKLDEWQEFCKILKTLPYIKEITEG